MTAKVINASIFLGPNDHPKGPQGNSGVRFPPQQPNGMSAYPLGQRSNITSVRDQTAHRSNRDQTLLISQDSTKGDPLGRQGVESLMGGSVPPKSAPDLHVHLMPLWNQVWTSIYKTIPKK